MKHNLPENIKKLRAQCKMTLRKLSKELDCSESLICQWESGLYSPRFSMLLKIADVFGVTLDDLVFGEEGI